VGVQVGTPPPLHTPLQGANRPGLMCGVAGCGCRDGCDIGLARCQPGYYCAGGNMTICPPGTWRDTSYDSVNVCYLCERVGDKSPISYPAVEGGLRCVCVCAGSVPCHDGGHVDAELHKVSPGQVRQHHRHRQRCQVQPMPRRHVRARTRYGTVFGSEIYDQEDAS
jgi:hypothetical protein